MMALSIIGVRFEVPAMAGGSPKWGGVQTCPSTAIEWQITLTM
jgi:hypothetical protein